MLYWLTYWTITGLAALLLVMVGCWFVNRETFSKREDRLMLGLLIISGPVGWLLAWAGRE